MEQKIIIGYLLGSKQVTLGMGDFPNTDEFPDRFITDESEAFKTFEERRGKNNSGTGYWLDAYIAPVYEDGTIGARKFK